MSDPSALRRCRQWRLSSPHLDLTSVTIVFSFVTSFFSPPPKTRAPVPVYLWRSRAPRPSAEFGKAINWIKLWKARGDYEALFLFFFPPVGRHYPDGVRRGGGGENLDPSPDFPPAHR